MTNVESQSLDSVLLSLRHVISDQRRMSDKRPISILESRRN